jgi:hypothetical protein
VLLVAAVHVLVFIAILQIRVPPVQEVESFTSEMFFLSDTPRAPAAPVATAPVTHRTAARPAMPTGTETDVSSTAITLPSPTPTPPATAPPKTDWYGQLEGAAISTLEKGKQHERQLGALTNKYQFESVPGNPRGPEPNGFRWYDGGALRIDTRGSVPVLHLGDRCVMIAFILPLCAIGHIEAHGDLFDNVIKAHGETSAPDSASVSVSRP